MTDFKQFQVNWADLINLLSVFALVMVIENYSEKIEALTYYHTLFSIVLKDEGN